MLDNLNFAIINTYKDLCMNLLLNKNDLSMYSWSFKFEIFSLIFLGIHYLNIQFGTTLIIWVGTWPTLSSLQMSFFDDKSY
jgi:hypothetical protein